MELILMLLIGALMLSITAVLVMINREFSTYREVLCILNKHLNDSLEQQDKAIQELDEILKFKR